MNYINVLKDMHANGWKVFIIGPEYPSNTMWTVRVDSRLREDASRIMFNESLELAITQAYNYCNPIPKRESK